jgi:hypothetical protein
MSWEEDDDEATHIFGGNDPQLDLKWQVNVSETDTRTMTAVEIGLEFGRGALDTNDTFVWREGMRDWMPLGKCPELLSVLNQFSGQRQQSVPPPPPRHSIPPAAAVPIANYAPPAVGPAPMAQAPAPRPMQPSMPFATPAALSAGQSPLRGPMPSNPAMQTGAFASAAAAQAAMAPVGAPYAAGQAAPAKSNRLVIGLVAGGGVLVLAAAAAGFFFLRSSTSATADASTAPTVSATAAPTVAASTLAASTAAPTVATGGPAPDVAAGTAPLGAPDASAAPVAMAGAQAPKGTKVESFASAATSTTAKKEEPKPAGEFSVDAARSALNSAAGAAAGCGKPGGPKGRGKATVSFAPSGSVSSASIDGPFNGTPVGSCVLGAFRSARVPPFTGGSQSVTKSFTVK